MDSKKTADYISNWLKNYSSKSKTKGFVVGISGGIDSAVTASLAAQTNLPVLLVEMPIHQNENQISRGLKHIELLCEKHPHTTNIKIELTAVFDAFNTTIPASFKSDLNEMPLVNTRARLRMTALYYFAALKNYLVVGTGNKIEDFGIGFYTKYGDGGVDVSPIADLTKTEVYQLGKYLDVINEILTAAPTDGLFGDDRTDEDQIGATYPELEWAMEMQNKNKKTTDFKGREKEVFDIYTRLNTANQHKMNPIPICVIPEELK